MLIGGDDINNDIKTFSTCFSVIVYIRVRFRFALIGGNFTAQSTGILHACPLGLVVGTGESEVKFKFIY